MRSARIWLILLTAAPFLRAQTTQSLDDPRSVVGALWAAQQQGDAAAMRRFLHAADPAEERLAAALTDLSAAYGRLERVARQYFGPEAAAELTGNTPLQADALAQAQVQVEGDRAMVRIKDKEPMPLLRVGGQWKIPVAALLAGQQLSVEDLATGSQVQARAVGELADAVAAGRYKSAAEAMADLQGQLWRAATSKAATRSSAASRPVNSTP